MLAVAAAVAAVLVIDFEAAAAAAVQKDVSRHVRLSVKTCNLCMPQRCHMVRQAINVKSECAVSRSDPRQ